MASIDGLQRTGVFGSSTLGLGSEKCPTISKILGSLPASHEGAEDGFRVSKHMIPSKQSSNPSLLRALDAWTLSPFVNICYATKPKTHMHQENGNNLDKSTSYPSH